MFDTFAMFNNGDYVLRILHLLNSLANFRLKPPPLLCWGGGVPPGPPSSSLMYIGSTYFALCAIVGSSLRQNL